MSCQILPAFVGVESAEFSAAADGASNQMVLDSSIYRGKNVVGATWFQLPRSDTNSSSPLTVSTTSSQILVHQSRKRSLVKSWTVKPGKSTQFTLPTVCIPGTSLFMVVQDNNKLLQWEYGSDAVTDGTKATVVNTSFVKLLVDKSLPEHCVLVSENGAIRVYSHQLKNVASINPSSPKGSEVSTVNCSIVVRKRRVFLFLSLHVKPKNAPLESVLEILEVKLNQTTGGKLEVERVASHVLDSPSSTDKNDAVIDLRAQLKLSTQQIAYLASTWESGKVVFYKFPDTKSSTWFKSTPTKTHAFTLGQELNPKLIEMSDSFFCVASHHKDVELDQRQSKKKRKSVSSSGPGTVELTVWDALYGISLLQIKLPDTEPVVYTAVSRFTSSFVTATSSNINVFEFVCPKLTLAAAVGKLRDNKQVLVDANQNTLVEHVTHARAAVDVTKYVGMLESKDSAEVTEAWERNIASGDQAERDVIAKLNDPKATPTEKKFEACFYGYLQYLSTQDDAESVSSTGKKRRRSSGIQNVAISNTFASVVVERCCRDAFWGPFNWLLSRRVVSCNSCPSVVAWLLHHRQLKLLYRCFQLLPDISEKLLVDCLVYISSHVDSNDLESFHKELSADFGIKETETKGKSKRSKSGNTAHADPWVNVAKIYLWHGMSPAQQAVLNIVLAICSAPQNDVFLRHQVRRLSTEQVLLVLGCLSRALDAFDLCPDKQRSKYATTLLELSAAAKKKSSGRVRSNSFLESGDQVEDGASISSTAKRAGLQLPTRVQVASWISTLLDAHFQKLMLESLTNDLVEKHMTRLSALVSTERNLCQTMQSLQQPVEYLVGEYRVKDQRKVLQDYSIHEMDL